MKLYTKLFIVLIFTLLSFGGFVLPVNTVSAGIQCSLGGGPVNDPDDPQGGCYFYGFFQCPDCNGVEYCIYTGTNSAAMCENAQDCGCEEDDVIIPEPVCEDGNATNYGGPLPCEYVPTTECSDGIDNDGDGETDYPAEFWCTDPGDNDERPPTPQCRDGADNDGDGDTDYPADIGCSNTEDNDETNVGGGPVDGECSATHYNCSAGASASQNDGASSWTWMCNGSGGGSNASCSEMKIAPMSGTLALASGAPNPCLITAGNSSCTTNLSWSITNPQAVPTAITAVGMTNINVSNTLATPQSGVQSVVVPYGGRTFYLYNNNIQLASTASTSITSACTPGTTWNGTTCVTNAAPVAVSSSITPNPVTANGVATHTITLVGTDADGATDISSMFTLINYVGANAGAYRGDIGWSSDNFASWSPNFATAPFPASSGGGTCAKYGSSGEYGAAYTNILSCATSVSGNTRTVTLVVSFNTNFTTPTTANMLPIFVKDQAGANAGGWISGGTFNLASGGPIIPLTLDLRVNNGDYSTSGTALNVAKGQVVHFSWASSGNPTLNCWTTNGTTGWSSTATDNTDFPLTAPNTVGNYQYTMNCRDDSEVGMSKFDKLLAFFNPFSDALALTWENISDSAWLKISNIGCVSPEDCLCENDPTKCKCVSGCSVTYEWECLPPATSSEGIGFSTDLNGDGVGDLSGTVTLSPPEDIEYGHICNGGSTCLDADDCLVPVDVIKKPFYIEN